MGKICRKKKCEKQVRSPINKRLGENRNWNFFVAKKKKRNINKYKQGVFVVVGLKIIYAISIYTDL